MVIMLKAQVKRPAIAMIELIFAIVIMGIVLMSAPMLISIAAKSGYVAIQQEAINEAAARVNMIMGYHWDENSADERFLDPVLITASSTDGLTELNTAAFPQTGRRPGTPKESYRSFVREDGERLIASTTLGREGGENDVDDFRGTIGLTLAGTGAGANYIEKNVDIVTTVAYISDAPTGTATYNPVGNTINFDPNFAQTSATTTNIKRISTTLTSATDSPDELNKTIILHAFSCNIGGYTLEEKNF